MRSISFFFLAFAMLACSCNTCPGQVNDTQSLMEDPSGFIESNIKEQFIFSGLAYFYNSVRYAIIHEDVITPVKKDGTYPLKADDKFVAIGRFKVLVLTLSGGEIIFSNDMKSIDIKDGEASPDIEIVKKSDLAAMDPIMDELRYGHMPMVLAKLCKLVEAALVFINRNLVANWGLTVIVYAFLLKVFLIPLDIFTNRVQRKVGEQKCLLEPRIKEIKSNFKGEKAHNKIVALHKELGISSFYALKPMFGLFIKIPILIATFNALGEMPQFLEQSFLWISDLAYPDSVYALPFHIPLLGSTINALPFVMTIVTIASTIKFNDQSVSESEMRSQKSNLYVMAIAFLILFYPFPAVMVLYWTMTNVFQAIQQQFLKS